MPETRTIIEIGFGIVVLLLIYRSVIGTIYNFELVIKRIEKIERRLVEVEIGHYNLKKRVSDVLTK